MALFEKYDVVYMHTEIFGTAETKQKQTEQMHTRIYHESDI